MATREVEMVGNVVRYQGSEEDEAGFLRRRRVGPAGRTKYLKAAGLFTSFCRDRRMAYTTPAEVDHALDIYLVWLFAKQRVPLQNAREAYYGVRFAFDLQNSHLTLARASLDGFKREDPDLSREPCPWEVATLVALDILEQPNSDAPLIAAAVLLDFDVYARPGALCGLECRSLIAVTGSRFCLVFFPGDREERSKGQTQDDTVEIGTQGREWLRGVAKALLECRQGPHKLFGISQSRLRQQFAASLKRLGLERLGYTPHCLRHGGASADAQAGLDAVTIQLRGQWRSPKSVVRYMKKGAYLRQLARLSKATRAAATGAEKALTRRLAAEIRKRAPRCSTVDVQSLSRERRSRIGIEFVRTQLRNAAPASQEVVPPKRSLSEVLSPHGQNSTHRRAEDGVWAPKRRKTPP